MISRLPKIRASTENAPGPRPAIAIRIVKAKTKELRESRKFGELAGSSDNPTARAPAAAITAAIGVRKPTRRNAPAASATSPLNHAAVAASAPAR